MRTLDTDARAGNDEAGRTCSIVIDKTGMGAVAARSEAFDGGIALALGFGRQGSSFDRLVARIACRSVVERLLEGMRVADSFADARRKARRLCEGAGTHERVSLLAACVRDGTLESEWVGDVTLVRLRGSVETMLCGQAMPQASYGGLAKAHPSFAKREVVDGDRLVAMSPNMLGPMRRLHLEASGGQDRPTEHEICVRLVHMALCSRVDHAALVVAGTRPNPVQL